MTASSIPAVVDQIITTIAGLTVIATPTVGTQFTDGYPGANMPDVVVSIGGADVTMATRQTEWAQLGVLRQWELYEVHGAVSASVGGDGQAPESASDAQKVARDRAFAVINAIDNALRADPTLGGVLQNGTTSTCGWARFAVFNVEETTEKDAALGRNCTVKFAIDIRARI